MIIRLLRSLCGLIAVAAALVGIPAGLWLLGGNPLPDQLSLDALGHALLTPDDGQLLICIIMWIGWLAWLVFAISILTELVSQLSGRTLRLPGFRMPQRAAAPLVAMLLAVFIGTPSLIGATPHLALAEPGTPTPGPTPTTTTQQTSTPRHDPAATAKPSQRTENTDRHDAGRRDVVHHTVERGENLWGLAKHYYGDGMQWRKIANANADLVGESGANYLEVGWQLTIPNTDAHNHRPNATHDDGPRPGHTYTVERGDTLSGIADEAYGEADRWPAIAKANRDLIHDPDLIDVGDTLDIPAIKKSGTTSPGKPKPDERTRRPTTDEHSTSRRDGTTHQDAGTPNHGAGTGHEDGQATGDDRRPAETGETATHPPPPPPATSSPQPQATAEAGDTAPPEAPAATVQAPQSSSPFTDTTLWAGPASALLAAGVVGVLARRRHAQTITRRPGRRLAAMSEDAERAVTALRQVEQPLTVAHLDRALRTLSAGVAAQGHQLPLVTAVRLDDDRLDLRLLHPNTEAPKPFTTVDGTTWSLTHDRSELLLDATLANQVAAPYPALVTLGQDEDGAHLLVDLETIAALALTTPSEEESAGILAALAFELATSTWADDLTISLVGACPELPAALGVDRARYLDHIDDLIDQLETDAEESSHLLEDEGLTGAHQGRLQADGADTWTPHILLIGHELGAHTRQRLEQVLTRLPRVAVAAVTTASSGLTQWSLTVTGDRARLNPLGLTLTPQRLAGSSYDAVCEALRQSQRSDTEPAPWWNHADDAQPHADDEKLADATATEFQQREELTPPPATPDHQVSATPHAPTSEATARAATDEAQPPASPTPLAVDPAVARPDGQDTVARLDGADPEHQPVPLHRATLLLLGPVEIADAGGTTAAARTANEVLEPLAYVYLHPDCPTTEFKDAMAGRTSKPDELASRARRYLGAAPDGSRLFPPARRDGTTRYYRLHPHVHSDWAQFQSLIARGVNASSTANLASALRLVRGRPLATIPAGMWRWAHDWREEAIATIVDTAHELAERRMSRGDVPGARWAIRQGRAVDELTEILARDEIRLERMAGNHSRVQRLADQIIQVARENRVDPDPETIELLHEIRDGRRRRTAQ